MEEPIINIENAEKRYENIIIFQNINVSFEKGKAYGIIGRNGSGKTVLLKTICGFIPLTSGNISVHGKIVGKDIEMPHKIGIIIETPGFLPDFSGYRNLKYLADICGTIGKREIQKAMESVGLDPYMKKHVGKYSMGMRQRLGIAQAIMEKPEILVLDEPMNGLDNQGMKDIRKLLFSLKESGCTILIASHNHEDIAVLCDDVYEINAGILMKKESNL